MPEPTTTPTTCPSGGRCIELAEEVAALRRRDTELWKEAQAKLDRWKVKAREMRHEIADLQAERDELRAEHDLYRTAVVVAWQCRGYSDKASMQNLDDVLNEAVPTCEQGPIEPGDCIRLCCRVALTNDEGDALDGSGDE